VQLRGPARVFPVLLHQGVDDARCQTREATPRAWPVAQDRDRVGGATRGVVPVQQCTAELVFSGARFYVESTSPRQASSHLSQIPAPHNVGAPIGVVGFRHVT
jgi:hypothetical protein